LFHSRMALSWFEQKFGAIAESSLMPTSGAKLIVADFGDCVGKLHSRERFTFEDAESGKSISMNPTLLGCSKERVQTAIAVLLADFVVCNAVKPSAEIRQYIHLASSTSGDLVFFTETIIPSRGPLAVECELLKSRSWNAFCQWGDGCAHVWRASSESSKSFAGQVVCIGNASTQLFRSCLRIQHWSLFGIISLFASKPVVSFGNQAVAGSFVFCARYAEDPAD
jgi:hypothetical protein